MERSRIEPAASASGDLSDAGAAAPSHEGLPEIRRFEAVDVRPVRARLLPRIADFRLELDGSPTVQQRDEVYFETPDWRLHRAGFTLRFVIEDGEGDAVLTSLATGESMRASLELTRPASLVESFLAGTGATSERVRALVGHRSLQQQFSLRSRLETFPLRQGDRPAGLIRLIETSVPVAGDDQPVRVFRVEVSSSRSAPEDFLFLLRHLRNTCGLRSVAISDYEAGLLAVGLTPPGEWDFGSTDVDRSQSVADLAFAVLREQFSRVLGHEPGTRIGADIEELHDMRVAVRRMRAAFRVFGTYLPDRAVGLAGELRWLGQALGPVRDLDVQIAQLAEWRGSFGEADRAAFEPIELALHGQRERARAEMLAALDSGRYESLVSRMAAFLREGPDPADPAGRVPAVLTAPRIIERRFAKIVKKGKDLRPSSDPERFHRLRAQCKLLRYVFEFHAVLYGPEARRVIKRLVAVQDVLGLHQDADVSVERIRGLMEGGGHLPPAAVFVLGRLCERYDRQAEDMRRRFRKTFRRLRGKRWKAFRSAMHRATGLPAIEPLP